MKRNKVQILPHGWTLKEVKECCPRSQMPCIVWFCYIKWPDRQIHWDVWFPGLVKRGSNGEWLLMGTGFLQGDDENVFKLGSGDGWATLWIYSLKITEFYTLKVVNFMACKLYLNMQKREKFIFSSLAQLYANILVRKPLYILNNYCGPPRAFVYGFCFQFCLCVYVKYPLTFTIKQKNFKYLWIHLK